MCEERFYRFYRTSDHISRISFRTGLRLLASFLESLISRLPLKIAWPPRFSSSASISPCYFHPGTFLSTQKSYINHFKSSVAIVLGDNVSLDFITFTVAEVWKHHSKTFGKILKATHLFPGFCLVPYLSKDYDIPVQLTNLQWNRVLRCLK